jgi:hypothetical protein
MSHKESPPSFFLFLTSCDDDGVIVYEGYVTPTVALKEELY